MWRGLRLAASRLARLHGALTNEDESLVSGKRDDTEDCIAKYVVRAGPEKERRDELDAADTEMSAPRYKLKAGQASSQCLHSEVGVIAIPINDERRGRAGSLESALRIRKSHARSSETAIPYIGRAVLSTR